MFFSPHSYLLRRVWLLGVPFTPILTKYLEDGDWMSRLHEKRVFQHIQGWSNIFSYLHIILELDGHPRIKMVTLPKTNMEPRNDGLEDDFPFQFGYVQAPCWFLRVFLNWMMNQIFRNGKRFFNHFHPLKND